MKRFLLLILLIISCPTPGIKKVSPPDYLKEAERTYQSNPLYAYRMLKDSLIGTEFQLERASVLVKIYLDQREYARAAALLDSVQWYVPLQPFERDIILLRTDNWERLSRTTADSLLKGIALYHMNFYAEAETLLLRCTEPDDYRRLYLARIYAQQNDFKSAFSALTAIDEVSPYLNSEYQYLLSELFVNLEDLSVIQSHLQKLDKPEIREYVMLRVYEKRGNVKAMKQTAWKLIHDYPKSSGAHYALNLVSPTTKPDFKAFGKVYYFNDDYTNAIEHFNRAQRDNAVNYYLGRIYYVRKNYTTALSYLARSNWSAADYYRGRIYEALENTSRAINVYDSLYLEHKNSKYATRGFKRKAFLLEDIGDTLRAVETFLTLNEKNTRFRAALQLIKIGDLIKADSILTVSNESEFLYWRIRIAERLGKSSENLEKMLIQLHPLSYYTLVKSNHALVFDTTSLDRWIQEYGDSTPSLSPEDSVYLKRAQCYFRIGEIEYATKELEKIENKSINDLLLLSNLCATFGADRQSILYSLEIKKITRKAGADLLPYGLYKLMYPVRYVFTIMDQNIDVSLCLAMIWQESLFDPRARSWANARGIMQIIPPTAEQIARDLNAETYSLYDPQVSIRFGSYYFINLLNELHSVPLSLAGYNAGPVRVKRWLAQDSHFELDTFIDLIPFNETRNYVKLILGRQVIYQTLLGV